MTLIQLIELLQAKHEKVGNQYIGFYDQDWNEYEFNGVSHHNDEGGDTIELQIKFTKKPDEPIND